MVSLQRRRDGAERQRSPDLRGGASEAGGAREEWLTLSITIGFVQRGSSMVARCAFETQAALCARFQARPAAYLPGAKVAERSGQCVRSGRPAEGAARSVTLVKSSVTLLPRAEELPAGCTRLPRLPCGIPVAQGSLWRARALCRGTRCSGTRSPWLSCDRFSACGRVRCYYWGWSFPGTWNVPLFAVA